MQKTSRSYARIMRAMALLKARDEANLAATQRHIAQLNEENEILSAMMRRETHADFVAPWLIAKRVERNHQRQHVHHLTKTQQGKTLLQSSRRHERVEDKYKASLREEDQQKQALNIGDYIGKRYSEREADEQ